MKTNFLKVFMSFLLTASPMQAGSDLVSGALPPSGWGSLSSMTATFTLSWSEGIVPDSDNTSQDRTFGSFEDPAHGQLTWMYAVSPRAAKCGNKEMLMILVNAGLLPKKGQSPFLAGWSLLRLCNQQGVDVMTLARHRDGTLVPLGLMDYLPGQNVSSGSATLVLDDSQPANEGYAKVLKFKNSVQTRESAELQIPLSMEATASVRGAFKTSERPLKVADNQWIVVKEITGSAFGECSGFGSSGIPNAKTDEGVDVGIMEGAYSTRFLSAVDLTAPELAALFKNETTPAERVTF